MEYSVEEVRQLIAAQGPALLAWVRWLGFINVAALLFVRRRQARWALAAFVFIVATNLPMVMTLGVVKALAFPHLLVWIPMLIYLTRELRWGDIQPQSPFGVWVILYMTTCLVSVIFDIRDGAQYILGDRGPIQISNQVPYGVVAVMALCALAMIIYIRKGKPTP